MAIPSAFECETYYRMWREGKSNTDIRITLDMSEQKFGDSLPYLLHYTRQKYKEDYREGMANGKPPEMILTEERRRQFLQMTAAGLSYPQISKIMNVPLPTIMDVWFIEDPVFKDQVDTVNDLMNARVIQAMYKKAIGYRTTVKTVTRMKGTGEKGLPVNTTTVSKQEKIVDGDFNAQKFWVINKLPKEWSIDGEVNKDGNKGSIMKLIEQGINEKDDGEDEKFRKEQEESEKQERITP